MSYVITGMAFIAVCIALFVWRMVCDIPTVVSGEPVQPELGEPTGLATGDDAGIAAGAVGGSAGGGGIGLS